MTSVAVFGPLRYVDDVSGCVRTTKVSGEPKGPC